MHPVKKQRFQAMISGTEMEIFYLICEAQKNS